MNNELIEEKAQLYALGQMPEAEQAAFEAQIREDRSTQALVHDYQRLLELDASEAREAAPSFQVYAGIMDAIDAGEAEATEQAASRRRPVNPIAVFATWGGWAVAACLGAVVGLGLLNQSGPTTGQSDIVVNNLGNPRIVAVQTPSEEVSLEDRMLELAGLAEAYWFSREGIPDGQQLADADVDVAPLSGGFTIFDREYNIGFIAVDNLPREAPERSYHVWAKTSGQSAPVRAGALPIGDQSRGLFFFELKQLPKGSNLDSLTFFVTEEETDSPSSPSQMVVLSDV